uniref:ATP-binding protein n=1 Tax=Ignisphaera aggregans TaxID=334771 RepID=A0A7C2ZS26_9CREN
MRRPFIASISGKGGTGKTTLTALLTKVLIENRSDDIVLVVDADPATNLQDVLGVKVPRTIGDVADEFRRKVGNVDLVGTEKSSLLQYWILRDCLVELERFDFLAMGRGEGEGCYCYVNLLLTKILVELLKNYTVVLMDMEAGLEHLSRRVDRYVNTLIVVVDPSIMSLRTAERIMNVAKEVNIKPERFYLVGNRIPSDIVSSISRYAEDMGYVYAGTMPVDENIIKYSLEGRSLLELPPDSPAVRAAMEIARNIGLID